MVKKLLKNAGKIAIAFAIAFLILNSTTPITIQPLRAQENNTLNYNAYAEGIQLLWGKNKAMAAIAVRIGGNTTIGFDINDPAFSRINLVVLSFGKGFDWTHYIHRPVWEIPPGASLILQYQAGAGYGEEDAIADAFRAANIIGSAYGLTYHVIWEEFKNNMVTLQFYAIMNDTDFDLFFQNTFKNILGSEGLMGLVTYDAILDSPYARLMLVIGRDKDDLNKNGNRNELIPVVGAAFIAENAVTYNDTSEQYIISINHIFQHTGEISWSEDSMWSTIEVKIPFPVILDRNASTPTNSSFPGITGYYQYILHAKALDGSWEYNWPSTLDDVVIKFKPYNYSERMNKFPVLQAKFTAEPYPISPNTYLTLKLEVTNNGSAVAKRVRAIIPLDKDAYDTISWLIKNNYFLPKDWELDQVRGPHGTRYMLRTKIGLLGPGDTAIREMTLNFNPSLIGDKLLPFNFGPIVVYTDNAGVKYSIVANGFFYPLSCNGTFLIPQVHVETPTGKSFVEVGKTVTVVTNLTNFGALPAKNISVQVIHGILDEYGNIIDMDILDTFHVDQINDYFESGYSYERRTTYEVRTKPGLHFVGAIVYYDGFTKNFTTSGISEFKAGPIASNLYSMFVLPPARLRGRIFRYPLLHAEISVNKTLTIDNTTGKIKVHLEISNVGDLNTTIIHIIDYWNASQVSFAGNVVINGTALTTGYGAVTNDKIGITYVVIGNKENPIDLPVNSTIIVEYELNIEASGSFELLSNPTIVIYDFGPYEMEKGTRPGKGENETSEGGMFYAAGVRMLQESSSSQFVQTFSQAILELVSAVTPAPGGGGTAPTPKVPRVLVLLIGIALVVIIVGGIFIKKRE